MSKGYISPVALRLCWILPCFILALVSCSQPLKPAPKQGLHKVIVMPTAAQGRVSAMLILPNTPAATGLAHYTEHLVWLNAIGNKQRRANSHSNAWTSSDSISYWLAGDTDELPTLLSTLAGVFSPLKLEPRFAKEELGIVLREYDLRIAQNANAKAFEQSNEFLYAGTHYADSLIGTPEQIHSLDYELAKALHAKVYQPQNAVLYVSGDVTEAQVLDILNTIELPANTSPAISVAPQAFALAKPDQSVITLKTQTASPRLLWRKVVRLDAPVNFDILESHCIFLNDLLTTSLPGGLAGPLRFDAMIASHFEVNVFPHDEQHLEIVFAAQPDENISLSELKQAFEQTLAASVKNGIPTQTYERIRKRFDRFWPKWNNFNDTSHWVSGYQQDRLKSLRTPLDVENLKQLGQNITQQSTNKLLSQLGNDGRTTITYKDME